MPQAARPASALPPTSRAHPLQVRASSLADLVYKQGQAGISKATVSVTFNNDDPYSSPPGYEDKKEIIVTRQVTLPHSHYSSSHVTCGGNCFAESGSATFSGTALPTPRLACRSLWEARTST